MKAFIIKIEALPASRYVATNASAAFKDKGFVVELFEGTHKDDAWQILLDEDLKFNDIKRWGAGLIDAELGAFHSHKRLWHKCLNLNENILILEHDAVIVRDVDIEVLESFNGDVLNLGIPNWGDREWEKEAPGIVKREKCTNEHNLYDFRTSPCKCETKWLYGAHSYVLTPTGAGKLLDNIDKGILPADLYIRDEIVDIYDLLPHSVTQDRYFSSIQKVPIYEQQKINPWTASRIQ